MRTKRNRRRIETKTSRTAQYTCICRAASFREKRECYQGSDDIAYSLVPVMIKLILKSSLLCQLCGKYLAPRGIYQYVIARTKYIDSEFRDALIKGFDQIVIFGAGFDSRAERFDHLNKSTKIFELDAPITQQEKLKAFSKKKINVPANLVFVPINFNKENLSNKLIEAGFETRRKSMFLMEGLTMYLSSSTIDSTFSFFRDFSAMESLVIFDYVNAGVLLRENRYHGEKDILKTVSRAGESWTFALEQGEIESFLGHYDFNLKDHRNALQLEKKYFRNREGKILGKINGTHNIAIGTRK